ncbi:outer membrane protein assembly factor BamB family protein [Mycobacterium colombiense]|uniref:outer membrane protein assembly factor BamB family protein n=1 Tax=Mycobacterium colombiense TaxID=339268 RepID=UPI0008007149|nr:PQQ-binding-like beta-propeller repeat protein [Mycobacterium colombiense]OBJ19821.1 pyrrolo-quinoline quinone [Mycobacterium colombiense]
MLARQVVSGLRRSSSVVLAAVVTIGTGACGNTDAWVDASAAQGWPAQYADAANSSYTATDGATKLSLQWTRSVKGSLAAGPALSARGYLALNAQTSAGCSLMEWENNNNGRQRWCVRLAQGGGFGGPLLDGFDNLYVGQPGALLSFPVTQWTRWRQPVIGMPTTPRFVGQGALLVATHLGQVLIFDSHRGQVSGSPLDLVDGVDPTDAARGLADCAPARQGCPVAAAPAFSAATGMVVLGVWQPGAPAAGLVGLKYHPGQSPLLTREWTSDAVGAGVIASPVLSADGSTVYVNGRDQRLWALRAADAKVKWSAPLGFLAQTPPAITPQGLIVTGGGPDTKLAAFKDAGDHADQVWRRDDVFPLSTSSLAGMGVGYTVASGPPANGAPGMSLLIFDPGNGRTLGSYPMPAATGYPVGVSVGTDRRVVAATSDGQVYGFAPA